MNLSFSMNNQQALVLACISTLSLTDQITQTDPSSSASIARSTKYESVLSDCFFLGKRIKPGQDGHLEVQ